MLAEKIKPTLMITFNVLFILTFGYILYNIIFQPSLVWGYFHPFLILIGGLAFLLLLLYVYKKILILSSRQLRNISVFNFVILIALQIFFILFFVVVPTWDFGEVFGYAITTNDLSNGLNPYFYIKYPNNIALHLIFILIIRFLNFIGLKGNVFYLGSIVILNIILILVTVACTYYFIYYRYGLKNATFFSCLMILITPLYTYTTIVYTDTVAMIFPILSFLLYSRFYELTSKKRYVFLLLSGGILAIGVLIKTNVLIAFIGIVIHYIMTQKGWKRMIYVLCIIILFIGINIIYHQAISSLAPIEKSEMGFPFTHWVMMGLVEGEQGPGAYYHSDVEYTMALKSNHYSNVDIKEKHLEVIRNRLTDYGFQGYISFLNRKINFTWSDGTYYAPEKLSRSPLRENVFQQYIFGEKSLAFKVICHIIQVAVLALVWVGGIGLLKSTNKLEQLLTITLFGVFLFLLIWETRSRYLVLYIPVILVLAVYGIDILNSWINTYGNNNKR